MRTIRFGFAALLAITLFAAAATPAFAGDGKRGDDDDREERESDRGRDHDEDDDRHEERLEWRKHGGDKWLLRNDDISVWFHQGENGKAKPSLKVFHTDADGNVSGYSVEIKRVIEIGPEREDDDDDDDDHDDGSILEGMRKYNDMKLSKKDDWNVDIDETNTTMTITMVRAEAQGIVTLVFHVSKTAPSVKFDFKVDNWQWDENASGHKLALVLVTHEREIRESDDLNATVAGGYISWAPTATVKYGNVSRVANVTSDTGNEDDGGRLALVFEAPGGYDSLDYDPTFGVASASAAERPLPSAPLAFAIAAVGAVALVARRRE